MPCSVSAHHRAALGLLMNWLGQAEQVPLEDGEYSFHALALRWMLSLVGESSTEHEQTEAESVASAAPAAARSARFPTWPLIKKFFDYLEANAEEYWQVPALELDRSGPERAPEQEEESLYSAAYEEMTYHDSADDNQEGAVADGGEVQEEFDLERQGERIARRLRFLSTVARLWQLAAHHDSERRNVSAPKGQEQREAFGLWLATARENQQRLWTLLDAIGAHEIPQPLGSYDSLVEYDRRRQLKEHLLYTAISTCLDTSRAVGTLEGIVGPAAHLPHPTLSPG